MHNRKNGCLRGSVEVIESLLLYSKRQSKWVRNCRSASLTAARTVHGAGVRHQELTLRIVVFVITETSREKKRALNIPAGVRTHLKASAGHQRLGNCILCVHHPPRTQILCQRGHGEPAAELVLQSYIARCIEILLD